MRLKLVHEGVLEKLPASSHCNARRYKTCILKLKHWASGLHWIVQRILVCWNGFNGNSLLL